ncbi:Jasmonate O-methyltransferase [Sesamum alatum]|uniref:Jasmonate O-methyltransferase n=1 Tax=Sesamum alatum TaxID=300844 RepID=A0AAE2CP45_9LAMI|nr:Jasmonate O-methyltransferase [Sesamum alatum]
MSQRALQKRIISATISAMDEAVADSLRKTLPAQTMGIGIADLGCSSGPNTLMVISEIINKIYETCSQMGIPLPELRVSLNDLPGNDFNGIFMLLPEFYRNLEKENGVGPEGCFISGVAGSFYGRLFPKMSLHFVHSSSSLHWLSQVPPALCTKAGKHLNKGKIYISKTSPPSVLKAYLSQFQTDFFAFLRSRAAEMVAGGGMLLSFMGRSSPDAAAEVGSHQWELLSQALMSMVLERRGSTLSMPPTTPHAEEVANIVEEEGSFIINHLQGFEIDWDGGPTNNDDDNNNNNVVNGFENLSRGRRVAKTVRAVVESMVESHFGRDIMDELFRRYGELVDQYFSKTRAKHINLVLSVTRINSCY